MSGNDKTGDKLVASIRKTKAGATEPASTASAKPVRTSKAPRKTLTPAAKRNRPSDITRDNFTSGCRVWPD